VGKAELLFDRISLEYSFIVPLQDLLQPGHPTLSPLYLIATQQGPGLLWATVLLLTVSIGTILALFGRRMARLGCMGLGMIAGSLSVFAWSRGFEGIAIHWMVIGSIAGVLLAAVLFRVWIGLSCAVVFAVMVPVSILIWEEVPLPTDHRPFAKTLYPEKIVTGQAPLGDRLVKFHEKQSQVFKDWWGELGPITHRHLLLTAAAGALIGIVFGLVYPYPGASVESALIGGVLILGGIQNLFVAYAPTASHWLPENPKPALALLGLITLIGTTMQWTVLQKNR